MNPITRLGIYLTFTISTLLSFRLDLILIHFIIGVGLILFERAHFHEWKTLTMPFWKYFPITGLIFVGISLLVMDRPVLDILREVGMGTLRLLILVSVMTIYIIQSKGQDIILALRSLWQQWGKPKKWVEDILLYLDITVRFFPSLQEEWQRLERSQKALSIQSKNSTFKKAGQIAKFIPDFIVMNLAKTETISRVMLSRGYGQTIPRSVYPFIPFKISDGILILLFLMIATGVHQVA